MSNGQESETKDVNQSTTVSDERGWRAALPDDLKDNEVLSKYSNIGDISKDFLKDRVKLANSFERLPENATDEQKSAFHKALGRPEKADGYVIDAGSETNAELLTSFKESAFNAGVSNDAAGHIFKTMTEWAVKQKAEADEALKKVDEEKDKVLKSDWGPFYPENSEKGKRVLNKFAGEEGVKFLEEVGILDHPVIKKMFFNMYSVIGEDAISGDNKGGGATTERKTASGIPIFDSYSTKK